MRTRENLAHTNFKRNQVVSIALQNASSPTTQTWLARRRHLQGLRFVRNGRLPLPASPTPSRTVACPERLLVRVCFTALVLLVHGREATAAQTADFFKLFQLLWPYTLPGVSSRRGRALVVLPAPVIGRRLRIPLSSRSRRWACVRRGS